MIERIRVISHEVEGAAINLSTIRKGIPIKDRWYSLYPGWNPPEEIVRAELDEEVAEIVSRFPFLASQRAALYFPEAQHLQVADDFWQQHAQLVDPAFNILRKREKKENRRHPYSSQCFSGSFFEQDGQKFVQLDTTYNQILGMTEDIQYLASQGFTVLDIVFIAWKVVGQNQTAQ